MDVGGRTQEQQKTAEFSQLCSISLLLNFIIAPALIEDSGRLWPFLAVSGRSWPFLLFLAVSCCFWLFPFSAWPNPRLIRPDYQNPEMIDFSRKQLN